MYKTSTEQLLDSIVDLFDEIDESDKETAGIALIALLSRRSGNSFQILDKARDLVKEDKRPQKKPTYYEELVN